MTIFGSVGHLIIFKMVNAKHFRFSAKDDHSQYQPSGKKLLGM